MVKRIAQDRPMSFEDVGVIGSAENAADSDVQPKLSEEQSQAAARPADASSIDGVAFYASGFARVQEPEPEEGAHLPEGYEDFPGFRAALGNVRDNFESVVLFPGFVFTAPGRYVDIRDVNKVYDVMPGEVSPDDLFLLGINYLVPGPQRDKILRGEVKPQSAPRQPSPLRGKSSGE